MADVKQNEVPKTLDDLKDAFRKILELEPNLGIRDLKKHDPHFKNSEGVHDFHNAKRGKISFEKIRRIVDAANNHLAEKNTITVNPEVIRNRQKLIPSN